MDEQNKPQQPPQDDNGNQSVPDPAIPATPPESTAAPAEPAQSTEPATAETDQAGENSNSSSPDAVTAAPTEPTPEPTVEVSPVTPEPQPQPEPAPAEQPVATASSSGKKRILLVEDDEGLASVYIARLEAEDFDIRHVPNGEEALSNAIEYKPDMILLDVMMPKISGFDVLDILRNTPETTNIKIIMLTALSQQKDKERAQTLGVDDYLVKSQVVIADVVERIKYHLGVS